MWNPTCGISIARMGIIGSKQVMDGSSSMGNNHPNKCSVCIFKTRIPGQTVISVTQFLANSCSLSDYILDNRLTE
ncbi:hypothetical protein SLA2020_398600 [Shorea laevis]